jgi:spore coat polysaccharide biosynthesis predicted glycosyltransferase SpsG
VSVDVAFVTGAHRGLGFGHAARCLHLARLVRQAGLSCGLFGSFSAEALTWIRGVAPDIVVEDEAKAGKPVVAVIDRLFDHDDAESVDVAAIDDFRAKGSRVVAVVSGTSLPRVPDEVVIVGYQPTAEALLGNNVHWGLDYAPVPPGAGPMRTRRRDAASALVALGGHRDFAPLGVVCRALASVRGVITVKILVSPVALGALPSDLRLGAHQTATVLSNVSDVLEILAEAGLVIASYGNLVFEALAVGTPVCVVGQKPFQIALAERLASFGLCVNAGGVAGGREAGVAEAIGETLERRDALSAAALKAVDGRGFERIAGLIVEAAGHG